jgi:sugar (pentulose or hexulose) kinase
MKIVIGIDLGTQGVRVLAVDPQGQLLGIVEEKLPKGSVRRQAGLHEQDVHTWWPYTCRCIRQLVNTLPQNGTIEGVSVDSTSGSLVVIDQKGDPLHPAIMYNDKRSAPYVAAARKAGRALEQELGYSISSSFALPKMMWVLKEQPELDPKQLRFRSETDFIVGKLSGSYHHSDFSNMLKFGYHLLAMQWPDFIEDELGVPLVALPNVTSPGSQIATVSTEASVETGLPTGVPILAGATDGTAAQVSSGAVEVGSWNSALGTTLVLKGITKDLLIDEQQRIYCHRHPETGWMPGGASNTGADWIAEDYPNIDPESLNQKASGKIPTSIIRYPLLQTGERFPFSSEEASGFISGKPGDDIEVYAAGLEGVALLEKLAYDTLAEIGAPVSDSIHITEGGSRSALWSEIRASVLNKTLLRPKIGQAGMGAAILAARGVWFDSLGEAAKAMVQLEDEFHPNSDWIESYQNKYQLFVAELARRGYLSFT